MMHVDDCEGIQKSQIVDPRENYDRWDKTCVKVISKPNE